MDQGVNIATPAPELVRRDDLVASLQREREAAEEALEKLEAHYRDTVADLTERRSALQEVIARTAAALEPPKSEPHVRVDNLTK